MVRAASRTCLSRAVEVALRCMTSLFQCGRLWACVLMVPTAVVGFAAQIPTGQVLEKVACTDNPAQTYALYLPTNFSGDREWPVLFCFDPGARGKAPVERFQAAAEKFGWIVAGSNNSRNGPREANAAAISAMLKDVSRHLPIDRKRLYSAGLSGGARVASQLAVGGMVHGVIACSAGFAGSETPAKVPFLFFGTAGETDFNYPELRRVDRDLDDRRAAHRVVVFDGGHEWLPAALAVEAFAWFELQAMRVGAKEKNFAWIQELYGVRTGAVPAGPPLERYRALKSIAADFSGLQDVTGIQKNVTDLAASRDVRDALKAERVAERNEEALREKLISAAVEGFAASVRKTILDLQAKAQPGNPERAMAVRVLQGVAASCGEAAREAMRTQDYHAAAPLLEMATLLRPERAQNHFELARARAQLGEKKKAIEALQQAVAAGFKDAARVEEEKAFDKIRSDPAFVAAIASLR